MDNKIGAHQKIADKCSHLLFIKRWSDSGHLAAVAAFSKTVSGLNSLQIRHRPYQFVAVEERKHERIKGHASLKETVHVPNI